MFLEPRANIAISSEYMDPDNMDEDKLLSIRVQKIIIVTFRDCHHDKCSLLKVLSCMFNNTVIVESKII